MTHQMPYSHTSPEKTINPEQFTPIIEAILAGKYSWACLLLLRYLNYNPLHYIPYRTYHRLVQENGEFGQPSKPQHSSLHPSSQSSKTKCNSTYSGKQLTKITDLAYLEQVSDSHPKVRGGYSNQSLESDSPWREWVSSTLQSFLP